MPSSLNLGFVVSRQVLKCAQRFEVLIAERKTQESYRDMNDAEILQELVTRYNSYRANSAIRRWQLSPDMHQAMIGFILGMTSDLRAEIRAHLDHNKCSLAMERGSLDKGCGSCVPLCLVHQ